MSLFPEVEKEIKQIKSDNLALIDEVRKASKPFVLTSYEHEANFEQSFCYDCSKYEKCNVLVQLRVGVEHKDVFEFKDTIFCVQASYFDIRELIELKNS